MGTEKAGFGLLSTLLLLSSLAAAKEQGVTYDGTSLIINGRRELLFSGSIHYPRSTPHMWPDLIRKAKAGGLNVIQTYVFWNIHEPIQGQFNFTGNYDLARFIKMIGENDMYVTLRIGPFIQAEWNHGGLPYWLREVANITFRSDNPPFKHYMEKYVKMIIQNMKDENLFAPQGGPIILAQIENEYNSIQLAYREAGTRYVQWAANLALKTKIGVPWIMCKQRDAPDPVINACNGRHCGDTFTGPNKPYKPSLWTENWTAQYRVWGDPPSQRAAEDLAFSVARFFAKNGTLVNYYMYHGGTNLGRTSSVFTTTRYYDEAPLDEYGLQREPKWSHLRDLHKALRMTRQALLFGVPHTKVISNDLEASAAIRYYEVSGTKTCSAFLTNNNTNVPQQIEFRGEKYLIPPRSISILPDCKTVVYNTDSIVSQHNARNFLKSEKANNLKWEVLSEVIPDNGRIPVDSKTPRELYELNKDTTDYAWYTTRYIPTCFIDAWRNFISRWKLTLLQRNGGGSLRLGSSDLPFKKAARPILRVASLGHALLAFVNGEYDSGAYMEHRYAGPRLVTILGLNTGTLDLTLNGWGHQVGLEGEKVSVYTQEGSKRVQWSGSNGVAPPVSWYKAYFQAPEGEDPVVIRLPNMTKGMVWVNGKSIGRYWNTFLTPLEEPSQSVYHIPKSFIKPTDNLLVVFDEEGGDPSSIEILIVNRDTICSSITENHPPNINSWNVENRAFKAIMDGAKPAARLHCPNHKKIVDVEFASFGDPEGVCGQYIIGKCNSAVSKEVVEKICMGKEDCEVPLDQSLFDKNGDGCPDIVKTLTIQARCSH
ncbi:hypothetical protein SAY87_008550 [Trapa incisa]|uniref:Beta-galactosidase n=1 Tax=Trapa incisa TaxID=236973 RepID=A0AAN7K0C7_9MYRT|nr:hypothetical protein SAY87_008550 [Trapa incisa]